MKVLLYGRFGEYANKVERLVKSYGLEILDPSTQLGMTTPDVVVTVGGDGTLIGAERDFPGVPKLPLRDSNFCFHCSTLSNEEILKRLSYGKMITKNYLKIQATIGGKKFLSLNDFVIRNKIQTAALRFNITVNREPVYHEPLIGDGVVIASPFGSTGYFFSITRTPFTSGIGLAFNNIHNLEKRFEVAPEDATIEITITRGPGQFSSDNNPEIIELVEGDKIIITKSPKPAQLLVPA